MDTRQKKAGPVILCAAVILTLSLGFVFTVNAENKDSSERIKEDIKIAADIQFLPDPAIYAAYSAYGITISEDGSKLLYNGKKVRLFVDEYSDTEAFYSDDTGTIDLSVHRDTAGRITGIERISEKKAGQYRDAFFADESGTAVTVSGTSASGKYDQYTPYGVTCSADGQMLYYNGQRVRLLADKLTNDAFETLWQDEAGTSNLSVTRNSDGRITGIERISKEKADQYLTEADAYTEKSLDGLEEKIAAELNVHN